MIQILPVTDLRTNITHYLEQLEENPIVVTKRGRPCAVLLDYVQYQRLMERLENLRVRKEAQEKTPHHTKHKAAIRLLDEWMADESGYDETVWPIVKQDLEENRLSDRRAFVD